MKQLLFFLIIFIAAASFRLTALDLIEFKLDEARDVYEMNKFFKEPYLFQKGPIQSTGVYNPPLWYYFLALVSLPSRNPQYLSFIIALLNSLAVAGFYLVVNRFYGARVGVIAGLLLAFSPWSILLARKIWSPDLIMVLLVPLFYFLLRLIHPGGVKAHPRGVDGSSWFWVTLLLSLIVQLHASGLFLTVATAVVLFFYITAGRSKATTPESDSGRASLARMTIIKYGLLGLFISLIPLIPYLAYQFKTGCEDCRNFFNYQAESKQMDINVFLRPFQFIGGSSFNLVLGEDFSPFLDKFPFISLFNIIFMLEFILAIYGVIFLCSPGRSQSPPSRLLLIFVAVIPLLYLITQTPAHLYYFIILSPIMMVIYGIAIDHLGGVKAHPRGVISWVILSLIIIINIIFELSFNSFLSEKQNIQGDFGPIYKLTKGQAEEKLAKYKNSPDYELIKSEFYVNLFNNQITP